jgi:Family of unknown function (DUF6573)
MTGVSEAYCINCRKPITRHRPWCDKVQTAAPIKQGDVVDHPTWGPTEVISTYSRQEAVEDGVLVDCTDEPFDELNRNAGIIFDVALTQAVFHRYVEVPERFKESQDIKGRYWDIICMFRLAVRRGCTDNSELLFKFLCLPNGAGIQDNERRRVGLFRLVQLKAVIGAGDRGEPCLTIMLPEED